MTDNRSPAFAPEFGSDDVRAMNILTGGYPAEYGRKLGGVIEVVTTSQTRRGLGGAVSGSRRELRRRQRRCADGVRRRSVVGERGCVDGGDRQVSRSAGRRELHQSRLDNERLASRRARSANSDRIALIVRYGQSRLPGAERTRAAGSRAAPGPRRHGNRRPVLVPEDLFAQAPRRRPRHGSGSFRRSLVQPVVRRR